MNRLLQTERLILRTATEEDARQMIEGRNSPFVLKYNLYPLATIDDIIYEITHIDTVLLTLKDTGKIIGCIYVKEDFLRYKVNSLELAAWIVEDYGAQGYMTEAGIALMRHLFADEGVNRLTSRVFSENTASLRINDKLGFEQEGYLPEAAVNDKGKVFDLVLFSVTKERFAKLHGI
ncbi:MAG: GNAT family N-acetyltransferase [Candidatus Coproplasma sp.]